MVEPGSPESRNSSSDSDVQRTSQRITRNRAGSSGGDQQTLDEYANVKPVNVILRVKPPKQNIDDGAPKTLPSYYKSPANLVQTGDMLAFWWARDKKFFCGITKNLRADGSHCIEYEDGQVFYHDLERELFHFCGKTLDKFLEKKFPEDAALDRSDHPTAFPELATHIRFGDEVNVFWNSENCYYPGMITGKTRNGEYRIAYNNGDKETANLKRHPFRFIGLAATRVYSALM